MKKRAISQKVYLAGDLITLLSSPHLSAMTRNTCDPSIHQRALQNPLISERIDGTFNPPQRAGTWNTSVTPTRFNSTRLLGSNRPNNVADAGETNSATLWTSGQKLTPEVCPTITDYAHGIGLRTHLTTIH